MKNVIAALALVLAAPALAGAGDHDVGVAGVDYEVLVQPDRIEIIEDGTMVLKHCGVGTHGCAILGKSGRYEDGTRDTLCFVYIRKNDPEKDITLRHELKHCFGYAHKEMPKFVMKRGYQAQSAWLERNHKKWHTLDEATLKHLRDRSS